MEQEQKTTLLIKQESIKPFLQAIRPLDYTDDERYQSRDRDNSSIPKVIFANKTKLKIYLGSDIIPRLHFKEDSLLVTREAVIIERVYEAHDYDDLTIQFIPAIPAKIYFANGI